MLQKLPYIYSFRSVFAWRWVWKRYPVTQAQSHGGPESNILHMPILWSRILSFNTGMFKCILKRNTGEKPKWETRLLLSLSAQSWPSTWCSHPQPLFSAMTTTSPSWAGFPQDRHARAQLQNGDWGKSHSRSRSLERYNKAPPIREWSIVHSFYK